MKVLFNFSIGLIGYLLWVSGDRAQSQVVPDASLPQPSRVTPEGTTDRITDGTQRGSNLFHSFREFSIPTGRTAFFDQAPGIETIFTRVTGNSVSNIDGIIRANGNASLFLLNPNGILFGPNAALNIGGSFLATTSDRIDFADGTQFSAVNPQPSSLLTVSVPVGLQFGQNGNILNQSQAANVDAAGQPLLDPFESEARGLRVLPGRTLALIGGNLNLDGGSLVAGSVATEPGGNIVLGSVASGDRVLLNPIATGWAFDFTEVQRFGPIRLSPRSLTEPNLVTLNASGESGGAIQLYGNTIRILNGSQIISVTQGDVPGETISLNASESINILGDNNDINSLVLTQTLGQGTAGAITATTSNLAVRNGGFVVSLSSDEGQSGEIAINAAESVEVTGRLPGAAAATIFTLTETSGQGGDLRIVTPRLIIREGAEVGTSTLGEGRGGNIRITSDFVEVNGIATDAGLDNAGRGGNLFAQTQSSGRAGNLNLRTDQLVLRGGGQITSLTASDGQAGNVKVWAGTIDIDGVALDATGQPLLTSDNQESVELEGGIPYPSGIFSSTDLDSSGNGGELRVTADRIRISGGGVLQTNTYGSGRAGNLTVRSRLIDLSGTAPNNLSPTGIIALSGGLPDTAFRSIPGATGRGGSLNIQTQSLSVRDGAAIAVSSINPRADGAGQIDITANTLQLNNGQLNAGTRSGRDANIRLNQVNLLALSQNSRITTSAGGQGTGGDIRIRDAGFVVTNAAGDNDITANAVLEDAGNITINAQGIIGLQARSQPTANSDITATSQTRTDGEIRINAIDIDPTQGLLELPANLLDRSQDIARACAPQGDASARNVFVTTGRGGLPSNPGDVLRSPTALLPEWIAMPEDSRQPSERSDASGPPSEITEATAWIRDANGRVEFVSRSTAESTAVPLQFACAARL